MGTSLRLIVLLCLIGCTDIPPEEFDLTPAECRTYGVDVKDNDTITGEIVISKHGSFGMIYKECGEGAAACAKGIDGDFPSLTHKYGIYYTDRKCEAPHEACHALYEEHNHTRDFLIRQYQGDKFAACPS